MVYKYYLLEVYGDIRYWVEKNGLVIDFPIAHHKFAPEKMVVIDNEDKKNKADIRYHRVQTEIVEFQWNELDKTHNSTRKNREMNPSSNKKPFFRDRLSNCGR